MTTKRQIAALHFCEEWLDIKFKGNINNFRQVSIFLSNNLENAKSEYSHAYEIYSEEAMYRDMNIEFYD